MTRVILELEVEAGDQQNRHLLCLLSPKPVAPTATLPSGPPTFPGAGSCASPLH